MLNLEHRSLPPPRRPMGLRGADCPSPSIPARPSFSILYLFPSALNQVVAQGDYHQYFNIQIIEKNSIAMCYLSARPLSSILYLTLNPAQLTSSPRLSPCPPPPTPTNNTNITKNNINNQQMKAWLNFENPIVFLPVPCFPYFDVVCEDVSV